MQARCSFVVSTETAYECLHKDVSFPLTDAQIYALCCSLATSAVFSQVAKSEVVNTISTVPECVCVRVCDWWQGIEVRPSGQRDKSYSLILPKHSTASPAKPIRPHLNCMPVHWQCLFAFLCIDSVCVCVCFKCLCVNISFFTLPAICPPAAWIATHLDNKHT